MLYMQAHDEGAQEKLKESYQKYPGRLYYEYADGRHVYSNDLVYRTTCWNCNGEAYGRLPSIRYCSSKCARAKTLERKRQPAHRLQCTRCGTEFEAKRKDARFCSNKCRQANHRVTDNKSRQLALLNSRNKKPKKESGSPRMTQAQAARLMNVSLRSVQRAGQLLR